jgi:hypothetical protein
MAIIEVERVEPDGLSRQVWRFHSTTGLGLNNTHLRVEYYGQEQRASKRHKWVSLPKTRYTSFDTRSYYSGIAAQDVPLPVDVAAQAKDLFMHSVQVVGPFIRESR